MPRGAGKPAPKAEHDGVVGVAWWFLRVKKIMSRLLPIDVLFIDLVVVDVHVLVCGLKMFHALQNQ
eukprot:COSAG02_NODE_1679_length_11357_cov_22.538462_2_plen_66_part_00